MPRSALWLAVIRFPQVYCAIDFFEARPPLQQGHRRMRQEGLTMKTAIYLAVLVLMSGLMAGCGQKGSLERPQEVTTAVSSPADDSAENR